MFTHSTIDGHLVFFYLMAIINIAAMNSHIQIFGWKTFFISLGHVVRSGIPQSCGNFMFNVLRDGQTFPQM